MNTVNHLDMYLFFRCHTQLTTYINMTNHLYEHDKSLRMYLFIQMLSLVNHLYKHGKSLRHVLIYSDVNHLYKHDKPLI